MTKVSEDFVILGAGITGLMIADHLVSSGARVALIEKNSRVGGLAQTIDHNGFKFDLGGHRLYFSDNINLEYIKCLLGPEGLVLHKRKSSIFRDGKYLNYPPAFSDCFYYGVSDIAKFFFENLPLRRKRANRKDATLEDWILSRFGSTIHNLYFRDYSQKVWGLSTKEISADWAQKRIGHFSGRKLLKEICTGLRAIKENTSFFYYPDSGIGSICDALYDRIKDKTRILLGSEALNILHNGKILNAVSYKKNGEQGSLEFKQLISTIPLLSLCELIDPPAVSGPDNYCDKIKYRSLVLVCLIINQDRLSADHWIYFPGKNVFFSRISEPKNWSDKMVNGKKTSLCCEVFCNYKDEIWNLDDNQAIDRVVRSLREINPAAGNNVCDALVMRLPFAYPLWYQGYDKDLRYVFDSLSCYNNLTFAGRNGTHSYFDMEECCVDAQNKARLLLRNSIK